MTEEVPTEADAFLHHTTQPNARLVNHGVVRLAANAKARALARAGYFYGLPPLEFELGFENGFNVAREWLEQPSTKEELERLSQESRAKHKAA